MNVGGEGTLLLSQAIRRLGRVELPLPTPALGSVGRLSRRFGFVDYSPEQMRFLNFGRVVDTTVLRTEFGYLPRYSTEAALADYARTVPPVISSESVDSAAERVGPRCPGSAALAGVGRRPAAPGARRLPASGRCRMPEARVIPLRPDDDEPFVPAPAPSDWEAQVAGGLDFLRRRLSGEYETDEFGFDPDLADHVCCRCSGRCSPPGSGWRATAWRTCPTPAARCWWPTTRAPCRSMP